MLMMLVYVARAHQRPQRERRGAPSVLMMLVYVARARAQAPSAQLGLHFSRVSAFDALCKTARFHKITEAIANPSLFVYEVLLMLMMRSS